MKNKLLILAMGFALSTQMIMAQVPSYVPTNGLVGYWPFNGNANDESGNGNNGTVNGAALTTDRFGSTNSAYSYTSGANLICTSQNFSNPNSLSYSVWFKTDSNIGGHLIGFNKGQCVHDFNWDRALWVENNKVVFYTFPGFQQSQNALINVVDNTWHNCVVTMDSQGAKIYIDGVLISSNNTQVIGQVYNGFFRFGGLSPNNINNSLIGSYDDIGVWNRALSEQEITNLYNSVGSDECLTMTINTGPLTTNPVTYTSSVTIYPNPANDQITIDCGNLANVSGWSIKITNMLGQEVFNQP
ncbi:MAG: hypothetical protein NT048_06405, partial [Flavobacterium sp.]|nr:hypothetical protein [Flavobacterium sp.]